MLHDGTFFDVNPPNWTDPEEVAKSLREVSAAVEVGRMEYPAASHRHYV
jgi:hypothetical protein